LVLRGWTKGIPKKDENKPKLSSIKWKKHFQGAASNSSPARRATCMELYKLNFTFPIPVLFQYQKDGLDRPKYNFLCHFLNLYTTYILVQAERKP
jgi:hypothetical protein